MPRHLVPLLAVALVALSSPLAAQSLVYQESFTTDGNPSRYTTSVPEAITGAAGTSDENRNYFTRTDGSTISSMVVLQGANGFYFAAQDVDDATGTKPVSLTIPNIDITTVTGGLQLRARYAEDDATSGGAPVESWDKTDRVRVYASIDGGTEVLVFAIESSSATDDNTAPRVDTNLDGVGEGTEITDTFTELSASIAGTGASLTLRYEFDLNGDQEDLEIDDISVYGVTAVGQTAVVAFSSAGTPDIAENGGTTSVEIVLTTSDGQPLGAAVSGTVGVTSGTNDSDFTLGNPSFSFAVGAAGTGTATSTTTVTGTDDSVFEGTEPFELGFATVTGAVAGTPTTFAFRILDDDPEPPAPPVRIAEVDANTNLDSNLDDNEFIELVGPPNYALDGLVIVLLDGADGLSYNRFDLDDQSTDANGVYVVGDVNIIPTPGPTRALFGGAQTGSKLSDGPDAVLLFVGNSSDFPNNTDIQTVAGVRLFDAMAYGINDARQTVGLLDIVDSFPGFSNTVQYNEEYTGDRTTQALARRVLTPPGSAAPVLSGLFYIGAPSPGVLNPATLTVDLLDGSTLFNPTMAGGDGADWRLLTVPVVNANGDALSVGNLATRNLIQGVPAGATFPAEYAGAEPNLFPEYLGEAGPARYRAPVSTDEELAPGNGFWWYWFDQAIDPTGSGQGTSQSFELTPTTSGGSFSYAFTGIPLDDTLADAVLGEPITLPITVRSDGSASRFGLAGNPFAYPYRLGGVSADVGTLSTTFQVYQPGAGYVPLTADDVSPFDGDAIGVGEGAFFEVTGVADGATVTLSAPSVFVDPTTNDDFNGRPAVSYDRLALRLSGDLADGTRVTDRAAIVRLVDDATEGWDRHDASKLTPLGQEYALVAPVGVRDGQPYRQAVVSLSVLPDSEMPLAFKATSAGTFTLSADALPSTGPVTLRDEQTGATADLRSGAYTFTAAATDWDTRFTVLFQTVVATETGVEAAMRLSAPAPNPTRGSSSFVLTSPRAGEANVVVVDALGRTVARLHDGVMPASGSLVLRLETGRLAPGVYVVRAAVGGDVLTRTLTVVR